MRRACDLMAATIRLLHILRLVTVASVATLPVRVEAADDIKIESIAPSARKELELLGRLQNVEWALHANSALQTVLKARLDGARKNLADLIYGPPGAEPSTETQIAALAELCDEAAAKQRDLGREEKNLLEQLGAMGKSEHPAESFGRKKIYTPFSEGGGGRSGWAAHSLPWPVAGARIAARGGVPLPRGGIVATGGAELEVSPGSLVFAVAPGTVIFSGQAGSHGVVVILEHAGKWISVYSRMGSASVEAGQIVEVGRDLGRVAGSRFYFELRHGTSPVDPLRWLARPEGQNRKP